MPDLHPVVRILRRKRREMEITQNKLSEMAGYQRHYVADLENGRIKGSVLFGLDRLLKPLGLRLVVTRLKDTD